MGGKLKVVCKFTSNDCQFKLAVGDLTTLPKNEAVNVLVVSAFPGDYAAVPGTLIGALKSKLDISVRNLAKQKEVDFRKFYNCWYSYPIQSSNANFQRILCFENRSAAHPAQAVGDVFRCTLNLFDGTQGKIALPILASGNQNFSAEVMLNATIESAFTWLKCGLSMRSILICTYSDSKSLLKIFNSWKDRSETPLQSQAVIQKSVLPTTSVIQKSVSPTTSVIQKSVSPTTSVIQKSVSPTTSKSRKTEEASGSSKKSDTKGALQIIDSFTVEGATCTSTIKFAVGDLTAIQKQDEIDVLVISAFPGDYAAVPRSLIGALKTNLNVSVRELARDKAADYRKYYSCWWSNPLPKHINFRRILCFEKKFNDIPTQVIGDVFRCLFPLFDNKAFSVAMPLLFTGSQGFSRDSILESLIDAAVRWIKAGLSLKSLLIANYTQNTRLAVVFKKQKKFFTRPKIAATEIQFSYDFYLSYSPQDINVAVKIDKELQDLSNTDKGTVRVHTEFQDIDPNVTWQRSMYDKITSSIKVIAILTPSYLSCSACMEQFNLALCANQRSKWHVLAPLYINTILNFPTYITLVQYTDCREASEGHIKGAVNQLYTWHKRSEKCLEIVDNPYADSTVKYAYDVFISYCHENASYAQSTMQALKEIDSELKIFMDTQQLKTGTAWQKELYEAIDGSKSLIALVTLPYIRSKVCYEEFSLASALEAERRDKNKKFHFFPILMENIEELPSGFRHAQVYQKKVADDPLQAISETCLRLHEALQGTALTSSTLSTLDDTLTSWRMSQVVKMAPKIRELFVKTIKDTGVETKQYNQTRLLSMYTAVSRTNPTDNKKCSTEDHKHIDIVISHAESEHDVAAILKEMLLVLKPDLRITQLQEPKPEKHTHSRLTILDEVKTVIALISPRYLGSPKLVEELHIMLFRQRQNPRQRLLFPICVYRLQAEPLYFRLLNFRYVCQDMLWDRIFSCSLGGIKNLAEKLFGKLTLPNQLVLACAAADIITSLNSQDMETFDLLININIIKNYEIDLEEVTETLKKL